MSFLDDLIGTLRVALSGSQLPKQPTLNFIGATVADDPTNKRTNVTIPASSAASPVASVAALKALSTLDSTVVNGQQRQVLGDPVPWIYVSTSGAGFDGDNETSAKPDDISTGSNGRWYRATSAPALDTIAALRLAGSGQHKTIMVRAFSTSGDGGGGTFAKVTGSATDNGGTIIVPTGITTFYYKRVYSGDLFGAWFGMSASNTDNAAAFTAALAALTSANGPYLGRLRLDPVIYPIQTEVTLQGNGFSGLRVTGTKGQNSGTKGTTIKWTGADGAARMIHVLGGVNLQFEHLDLDCNSKAKLGWDCEGKETVPTQGLSNIHWHYCSVWGIKDTAGAGGWLMGNASGFQCDGMVWKQCSADVPGCAFGGPATFGWKFRGGSNTKEAKFYNCGAHAARAIDWATPSGPILWIAGGVLTTECTFFLGEANFTCIGLNCEGCFGVFLKGTGTGGGSGSVLLKGIDCTIDCQTDADLGLNDVIISYRGGHVTCEGCHWNNNRGDGSHLPRIVVNSGSTYAFASNEGFTSRASFYFNATSYIPVVNESGVSLMVAATLAANPMAIFSDGDYGGPIISLQKLKPVRGKVATELSLATGVLHSTNGDISSSKVIDTDVDISANIASSKIAYGGATINVTSGSVSGAFFGVGNATLATAGLVRSVNGFTLKARGAGSYDLDIITNSTDGISIGDNSNVSGIDYRAKSGAVHQFYTNNSLIAQIHGGGFSFFKPDFVWGNSVSNPKLFVQAVSGTATTLSLAGQDNGAGAGGNIKIYPGGGSTVGGLGQLLKGDGATAILSWDDTGWAFGSSTVANATYTAPANHTDDRALDETGDTLAQVAHVLGTLINDLKAKGIIS